MTEKQEETCEKCGLKTLTKEGYCISCKKFVGKNHLNDSINVHLNGKPKNHSPEKNSETPIKKQNQDTPSNSTVGEETRLVKTSAKEGTFNLSKKIIRDWDAFDVDKDLFFRKDVKEFISRLKEMVTEGCNCRFCQDMKDDIDKLAGEDLSK